MVYVVSKYMYTHIHPAKHIPIIQFTPFWFYSRAECLDTFLIETSSMDHIERPYDTER